jgi:LysR family transcriptional regulator, glycine cleavage system transcriptional activator
MADNLNLRRVLTNALFSPIRESNSWSGSVQRTPSLHALRAFEAAARLGSFARASDGLGLTPSAISHQIRALEKHFGRPLFVRAGRQVILTTDGERLLAALSQAFNIIHEACAELSPPARKQDLRVHCTPSFAAKWLGPRLPRFLAQNPAINIRLSSNAEPLDLLHHDELDIVIAYGAVRKSAGLTVQSLGSEEIAALCSPAYATAHAKALDVARATHLESSLSPVRWADWFRLNGQRMPAAAAGPAFDRGSLVVAAAVQGLGVALETVRFAEAELAAGSLVRFGGERFRSIHRDMHFLCYRTGDQNALKVRKFCEWVMAESIV